MRNDSNVVEMIANAKRDLDELKELQLFGADALKIYSFSETVADPNGVYLLSLTPVTSNSVLPMPPERSWVYNGTYGAANEGATIYQMHTTDGSFQWEIHFAPGTEEIKSVTISLSWIGKATVLWRKKS